MTIVLGLHFGHDGNLSVVKDGHIAGYALRERMSRRKHDYGLDRRCLDQVLEQAGVTVAEIDYCAITSTQGCDILLRDMGDVAIDYVDSDPNGLPCPLLRQLQAHGRSVESQCAPSMLERVLATPPDPTTHPVFDYYFGPYRGVPKEELKSVPWFEGHLAHPRWAQPEGLAFMEDFDATSLLEDADAGYGFHLPVTVTIDGRAIPGLRLDHHLAHAASSYYRSPFAAALVVTNDGYGGKRKLFSNGAVYYGRGRYIHPLLPHGMIMGHLFHSVGMEVGFDPLGAPGKLMGLAPYGQPIFHDPRRIGNHADLRRRGLDPDPQAWIADVRRRATQLGFSPDGPSESWIPFNRYQLDLAASTQKLFEEQWLALIRAARGMAGRSGLPADVLCLSGGSALNCPANTRILQESRVRGIFLEPNVDDGGLSIGAALWVTHHMLGQERPQPLGMTTAQVYAGPASGGAAAARAAAAAAGLTVAEPADAAAAAADDLAAGHVIGWFEGSGEQGPRALGHRSILALPKSLAVRDRVNRIKRRELWRPLAPAVLAERQDTAFEDLPVASPYMLFTARVSNPEAYPAIAHVDGSARVQTVDGGCGAFRRVLETVERRTGCPLLLNTSLNGPSEPIVETPEDAIRFFIGSGLDALYVDGLRIGQP
ncbi:carbamoyltransferase C-terminal domain-containing protein [Azospirillum sp. HJ39]|uniref:carbamoyltransferase C-terminal domain-containing protein n=1 Tax=Azospirillum sp. HJ39 TaxID=3159496 RepID=UPI003556A222